MRRHQQPKRPPKRRAARVIASLKSTPISLAGLKTGGSKSGGMATAHPSYACWMKADWFGKEAQDTGPWIKSCKRLKMPLLIGQRKLNSVLSVLPDSTKNRPVTVE